MYSILRNDTKYIPFLGNIPLLESKLALMCSNHVVLSPEPKADRQLTQHSNTYKRLSHSKDKFILQKHIT